MSLLTRRDALRFSVAGAGFVPLAAAASAAGPADNARIFDVAFEGGGAKGAAFVGALEVLLAEGSNRRLRRLVGSSAGAITAALLAAGYSPRELRAVLNETVEPDPKGEFPDRPVRRMARLMDWATVEDLTRDGRSLSDLIDDSDSMKAFAQAASRARVRMAAEARDVAEQKGRVQAVFLRSFAGALESFAGNLLEGIIARSMLRALLENRRIVPLFAFAEFGGFLLGREFLTWLAEKLAVKGVERTDTLATFHARVAAKTGCDLSVVASDTTDREMLVLNHRTAPDCPVLQAVRMSMSIPFVFPEVEWRAEWGTYLGRPKVKTIDGRAQGNKIVDGGMLSNFPIGLLHAEPVFPEALLKDLRDAPARDHDAARAEIARRIMGPPPPEPGRVLGLLIDETQPVPKSPPPPAHPELFGRTVERSVRMIDTATGTWDDAAVQRFRDEICRLPAKGYGVLEFGMDLGRLEALLQAAREAMRAYFERP